MKISDYRVLVDEAVKDQSAQKLAEVYTKAIEIDAHYFRTYSKFRIAVVQSIQRNYWHKELKYPCQVLANYLVKIYEMPDILETFEEHPQDSVIYNYLLDIENHDLETIVDSESEKSEQSDSEESE